MKKAEIIVAIIAVVGLTLSLIGIPGGNILSIMSICFLNMLYYPLGFILFNEIRLRDMFKKQSYKGISAQRIVGTVGTGLVFSTALTGILFKLMIWPGASVMLLVSIPGILALAVIAFVKYSKNKNIVYKKLLIRAGIMGSLVLLLVIFPTMMRGIKYRNNPEYLQALEELDKDPSNPELQKKAFEENEKIHRAAEGR